MKMTPFFSYVVLEREKLKSDGIIIPGEVGQKHAQAKGKVLSAGPLCEDDIKALTGKTVLFKRHAGDWMQDAGSDEEFFIIEETDILAEISA